MLDLKSADMRFMYLTELRERKGYIRRRQEVQKSQKYM